MLYGKNENGREDIIMDAKEAIKNLKVLRDFPFIKITDGTAAAAISALEKVETLEAENARLRERETPKEVIAKGMELMCSNCNEVLMVECDFGQDISLPKYCWNCGQAIKIDKE